VVFSTLAEYPIAIVAALALRPKQYERKAGRADYLVPVGIGAVTLLAVLGVKLGPTILAGHVVPPIEPGPLRTFLVVGVPTILTFFAVDRPVRFAACLGAMFMVSHLSHSSTDGIVATSQRSFFGVHRVVLNRNGNMRTLVHGNTTHGIQDWNHPDRPLTYYYPTGPIGQVFTKLKSQLATEHVGLVGLGVGSLAAYGQPGQRMTYFEIDPTVRAIASDPHYFTFLSRTRAKLDIVMGDARLTVSQQPDGEFGLLVLDAFSSDAIPVHLLTKEAVAMYVRKLTPSGILAFHISNRYLDLEPVLVGIAREIGLVSYIQEDGPDDEEKLQGKTQSKWMVFARKKADLKGLMGRINPWDETQVESVPKTWTDDFSNVLGAFKGNED
jgi:SAM-dependent methyltransferase